MDRENPYPTLFVDVAIEIVLKQRGKILKGKGRGQAPLLTKQFLSKVPWKVKKCVIDAFINAEKQLGVTRPITSSDDRLRIYNKAMCLLAKQSMEAGRGKGRPRKQKGLISSVASEPVKRNGRPMQISPDEEQRWAHSVWGVAVCLWAERNLKPPYDLGEVSAILTSKPKWEYKLRKSGLLSKAALLIANDPDMQHLGPPAISEASLKQRARTALKIYPLPTALK